MKQLILLLALVFSIPASASEAYVPAGVDVGVFFATLPKDVTVVHFTASPAYASVGDIILPRRVLLIIDGAGATLNLGAASNGFTDTVHDQGDAMVATASRYVIKDFARINGGKRAVNLAATLSSQVYGCELRNQTEAAIYLRFCLLASVHDVLITNPTQNGIVVRCGDWPKANTTNSQSNLTTLEHCRVYCGAGCDKAFWISNSNGVAMRDCVSEGSGSNYDVYVTATMDGNENATAKNPVVKSFSCSGLHIEHAVAVASFYINMPPKAAVSLDNIYWNGNPGGDALLYMGGNVVLRNIGWWATYLRIESRVSSPRITVYDSHSDLSAKSITLSATDALKGHTVLTPAYVTINNPSK